MSANKIVVCLAAMCGVIALAPLQAQQQQQPDHGSAAQVAPRTHCTRESLKTAVDSYLAAQETGDRTKMAFAEKVKYLENMKEVAADKGMWNTALPVALSRSFFDKQ